MAVNVAISGFGRIGRLVLRSIIESKRKDINVVAINDLAPIETNAFLLSKDTVHGPLNEKISVKRKSHYINKKTGKRLRALVVVHLYGFPCEILKIKIDSIFRI